MQAQRRGDSPSETGGRTRATRTWRTLFRAAAIALGVVVAAVAWSYRRFEPPVILAHAPSRGLFQRPATLSDEILQELDVAPGVVLHGYFVPSDPGAPVVLHLLDSGASVRASRASYNTAFEQLADLGLASLAFDYSGVGVSTGERSPANLARDVRAMWARAVELAGGDPKRVAVRGVSIGTLAIAELLRDGADPGAIVMVAPVHPGSVAACFAKLVYGDIAGALAGWLFRPAIDVSIDDVLGPARDNLLVIAPEHDELVDEAELLAMRSAVEAAGGTWCEQSGEHFLVSLEARRVFEQEIELYSRALCPDPPMFERCASAIRALQPDDDRLDAGTPEFERFLALARFARGSPRLTAAVAFEIDDVALAARVRRWIMACGYDLGSMKELRARVDLDDPAGPLDFDEIQAAARETELSQLASSWRMFSSWSQLLAQAGGPMHGGVSSGGSKLGRISIEISFDRDALWKRLEARGLRRADLRRQFLRTLLKAQGTPERVVRGEDGRWLLEICDFFGGWEIVDPEGTTIWPQPTLTAQSFQVPH